MTTRPTHGTDPVAPGAALAPSAPMRRTAAPSRCHTIAPTPTTNLAANRHARRGATSGRGKCQPPATEGRGAATETSSPSRRRSPRAWATQNTRRSRKHRQHEVRAVSPAPLYGAAAVPSTGRGAANFNPVDRPDATTRAGEHWLGWAPQQSLSRAHPRGLVAANSAQPAPASRRDNPTSRRRSFANPGFHDGRPRKSAEVTQREQNGRASRVGIERVHSNHRTHGLRRFASAASVDGCQPTLDPSPPRRAHMALASGSRQPKTNGHTRRHLTSPAPGATS